MEDFYPARPNLLLRRLGGAIKDIHQCNSVDSLLCCIRALMHECFGFNLVWLYVFEDENKVRLITVAGEQEKFIRQELCTMSTEGDLMFSEIVQSDKPVYVKNALTDPRTNKQLVKKAGSKTLVNCRLNVGNKTIGTLGTGSLLEEDFVELSDDDLAFFEAICRAAAIAYDCLIQTQAAGKDALTQLLNRRGLQLSSEQLFALAKREKQKLGLAYIDLNDFKPINDQYGHDCGDEALKAFADLLKKVMRKSDLVARVGGDEFVVLAHDIKEIRNLSETLREVANGSTFTLCNQYSVSLTFSSGFALYPDDAKTLEGLITLADIRMYDRKHRFKNCPSFMKH